jgi:ABC-type glycerol-3-phosphate transport system substrate-binding protein
MQCEATRIQSSRDTRGSVRRTVLATFAAGAAGVLQAACGGGTAGSGAAGSASGGAAPAAVKFPETLTLTTIYNFQQNDPGFMAAADEFSKRHNVKLEMAPGSVADITAKIAAGTPPDVFRRDANAFHKVIADGGLRDLNPYLHAAKDLKAGDFYPHLIKMQSTAGKLYAIPEDFQPASTLYYNKAILDKAGEKPPAPEWTWNQLLDLARKVTRGSGDVQDQYGYMTVSGWWEQFVYNHGGRVVDNVENASKCLLDSAASMDGLQFLVDLQQRWKVMPSPQARAQAAIGNEIAWFVAHKVATVNHGTWATLNWSQAGDALQWGMTLAPKGQDGKWHYQTGGAGWAIAKDAKTPDASWEFIKWQFGPQGWKSWLAKRDPKVFWMPALRALAESEAKRLEAFYPNAQLVVKSADSIYFRPPGYKWERALMEAVNPALADIQSGKSPVRGTIQDAVRQANAILAGG